MPRTFIAVRIAPEQAPRPLLRRLAKLGRQVRVVQPDNLHVTLRFLGEVESARLPRVAEAVRQSVGVMSAFTLSLHGLGAYPSVRRPRIVWIGLRDAEPLAGLVARLSPLLDALGLASEDRPWDAHVTVARVRSRPPVELALLLEAEREAPLGIVPVRSVEVMSSELSRQGARYTVESSVPLPPWE